MKYFRGYQPRLAEHGSLPSVETHSLISATQADDADLSNHVPPVKDQGRSGSCVPHSACGEIQTTASAQGFPLSFVPSERGLYGTARAIARGAVTPPGEFLPPLVDQGTNYGSLALAVKTFGVRPRDVLTTTDGRDSDVEIATVNDVDDLGELEAGAQHVPLEEHEIPVTLAPVDRLTMMRKTLASGHAFKAAFFADDVFENWKPVNGSVPAPDPNMPADHSVYVYVLYTAPDGTTRGKIRNSWGTDWGDSGDADVSQEWLLGCKAFHTFALVPDLKTAGEP